MPRRSAVRERLPIAPNIGAGVRRACRRLGPLLAAATALQLSPAALAQRAGENAVTAAEDAFGISNGYQAIGLYSMLDARGFSPQQAGNLRIEGLYYDQPTQYLNQCMVSATTMRIGIAAQSYSFPAPTGIADLRLSTPEGQAGVSSVVTGGSYRESSALIEGRMPVSAQVSAFGCVAFNSNFFPDGALQSHNTSFASVWRWHPTERTDVRPFVSYMIGGDHQVLPLVYTDAVLPPPMFASRRLASQEFTSQAWRSTSFGVIVRQTFDSPWLVSAGLFRALEQDPESDIEEYNSVLPDRTAYHVLDVVPYSSSASTSGEMLLARRFGADVHQRTLQLMVRGRRSNRDFGGDALIDYGKVTLESPPPPGPVPYMTSPVSVDETRQLDVGAQLEERWQGVGTLGLGLLHSTYRRTILPPGEAPTSQSTSPLLGSVRLRLEPTTAVTIYASYVQGLEDSALAPTTAVNRGESPPATRSRQSDGGVRWAPDEKLSVIFGAFDIKKTYFNLDSSNVYTALGTIRHTGLESSVTWADRGRTVVAGAVWLRPRIDTGLAPIGPVPLTININLDWAPTSWRPWAGSLTWNWLSSRVATADNRYSLPSFATLTGGVRFETNVQGHPFSVRLDGYNLTNVEGLHLTPLELVVPELDRRFLITAAIDL